MSGFAVAGILIWFAVVGLWLAADPGRLTINKKGAAGEDVSSGTSSSDSSP